MLTFNPAGTEEDIATQHKLPRLTKTFSDLERWRMSSNHMRVRGGCCRDEGKIDLDQLLTTKDNKSIAISFSG